MAHQTRDSEPGAEGFVVAAVVDDPAAPEVFRVVAYQPEDVNLLAKQFPGLEARTLSRDVLSEHAQAEVRALLALATSSEDHDTVVVGRTDGHGGWESWNLRFFAPAPGPAPTLPEQQ